VSPEDALYHTVHDYKPGTTNLAERLGMKHQSLVNLANPNDDSFNWSLKNAMKVVHFTGDLRFVQAFCAEFNGVFVPLGHASGRDTDQLFEQLAKLGKEFGQVCSVMQSSLADGKVTKRELDAFKERALELQQCTSELTLMMEKQAEHNGRFNPPARLSNKP
jgi:hypothetical protein